MLGFLVASFLSVLCLMLILLILIQRGKGGGLAGAFGGMGGQSAFGTKAGDTFMRITIVFAAVWFLVCIGIHLGAKPKNTESGLFKSQPAVSAPAPATSTSTAPAENSAAPSTGTATPVSEESK